MAPEWPSVVAQFLAPRSPLHTGCDLPLWVTQQFIGKVKCGLRKAVYQTVKTPPYQFWVLPPLFSGDNYNNYLLQWIRMWRHFLSTPGSYSPLLIILDDQSTFIRASTLVPGCDLKGECQNFKIQQVLDVSIVMFRYVWVAEMEKYLTEVYYLGPYEQWP